MNDLLISEKVKSLAAQKGRLPSQKRLFVVRALEELDRRVTADELWFDVRQKGLRLSFPAVYSILNWLVKNGLVEKHEKVDRRSVYVLARFEAQNL